MFDQRTAHFATFEQVIDGRGLPFNVPSTRDSTCSRRRRSSWRTTVSTTNLATIARATSYRSIERDSRCSQTIYGVAPISVTTLLTVRLSPYLCCSKRRYLL